MHSSVCMKVYPINMYVYLPSEVYTQLQLSLYLMYIYMCLYRRLISPQIEAHAAYHWIVCSRIDYLQITAIQLKYYCGIKLHSITSYTEIAVTWACCIGFMVCCIVWPTNISVTRQFRTQVYQCAVFFRGALAIRI